MAENSPNVPDHPPVTKTSRVRRCLVITAVLLACLLLLVSLLLFTHTGNTLIWRQLTNALPALGGELTQGQLLRGWTIRNLSWQDDQVAFHGDEVTLKWQLAKIFTGQLPVQRLDLKKGSLAIQPVKEATTSPEPTATDTAITIPLDIPIRQIGIQNFTVTAPGTRVFLASFTASARWQDNRLSIPEVMADNLQVDITPETAPSTVTQPTATMPTGTLDFSSITLPEITLPFPINLEQLTLTHARYQQGRVDEALEKLELSFNWQAAHITGLNLKAEQTRADVRLNGNIQLSGHYPLALNMEATLRDDFNISDLAAMKGQQLALAASGNLHQLQLQLTTKGAINSALEGTVHPFAPNLPVDVTLKWPELQWPLQAEAPEISAANGVIRVAGDLKQYQLSLATSIQVPRQPLTRLTLNSSGNREQLTIADLSVRPVTEDQAAAKPLTATGTVNWKDGIDWQGQMHLNGLKPQWWLPDLPGILNGSIDTRFALADGVWRLSVPELDLTGSLLNQPLEATGQLEADNQVGPMSALPVKVNVHNLYAALGDNHLSVSGHIAEQLSLTASLDVKSPQTLIPGLTGSLQSNLRLTGSSEQPTLSFRADSPSIHYQQTSVSQLNVNGELTKTAGSESDPWAGKAHLKVAALKQGSVQLKQLVVSASGSEGHHQISLKSQGKPVSGELLIEGGWHGPSEHRPNDKEGQWRGQLVSAGIVTPVDNWRLEKPVAIVLEATGAASLASQCWLAKPAKFCIDASQFSGHRGSTGFQLSDFNLANLNPLLPKSLSWQAILSGGGTMQWEGSRPMAHLRLATTPGTITSNTGNPVVVEYRQLATTIDLNEDDLTAQFDFQSKQLGNAHLNLTIDNIQSDQQLSGQARLQDMQLHFLQPLIPDMNSIGGVLSADTRMGGTLKEPLLFGKMKLSAGQVVARQNIVSVSDLITVLDVNGNKGDISGSMKVGDGEMTLSGHLDWQQMPPSGVITMQGRNLAARYPGLLRLKASPDLKLTLGAAQTLTGTVTIPWARINVKQLPKQAVSPSDDVVIITPTSKETLMHAAPPFSMDVDVVLGDDIKMDAYGLKSGLAGRVMLNLQPDKPLVADGSIHLVDGRYHQFGQDLLIKEGNIVFSGPLSSPYLSVNAIRNPESIEDDVTVGIQVSGSPERPEFTIYSDPPMPQQEQWSYLLRGQGTGDGDSSAVQSMLVGFGVSQLGGVVTSLGEKMGLADVSIDTQGSGNDTQVTIGGTIAPGLRLQYGAGVFNSIAEVKVRYELMPRLYLQAVSGVAQAVDLFYQFKIETGKSRRLSRLSE